MDAFQIASSILGASVFTTLFTILALTVFGPAIIAYAAERGKILATKDNFEELKVQLAETTATAKRIEVEIEQGRWTMQALYIEKKNAYAQLLSAIQCLSGVRSSLAAAWTACTISGWSMVPPHVNQLFNGALGKFAEEDSAFELAVAVAEVYLDQDFETILDHYRRVRGEFVADLTDAEFGVFLSRQGDALRGFKSEAIAAARRELGN